MQGNPVDSKNKNVCDMSGEEILEALSADTQIARVAAILCESFAEIELALHWAKSVYPLVDVVPRQRKELTVLEMRRIQLQVSHRICAVFGAVKW